MRRPNRRVGLGLGILGLAAAGTAAAFLALASGGNAASSNTCAQVSPTQANCLFVSAVPNVLSTNKTGLLIVRFKNTFANATATHTVLTATLPATGAVVSSVSASKSGVQCTTAPISCTFGSVPGGAIVTMYVQYTTSLSAGATLGAFKGFVSFDESNGNTGTTTNDTFESDSGTTAIVDQISNTDQGGSQAGLCTATLSNTGFKTTNGNGQQVNIGDLPAGAPGFPCTPVSAGTQPATDEENAACVRLLGVTCPAATAYVFFPVLAGNQAAVLTVNYPTVPSFVTGGWKNTPLYEFQPDPQPNDPNQLKLIQLVKCGAPGNLSPDSCLLGDPKKFGQGISFSVSVTGSLLDGRLSP
jgi:hypothetical protein